MKPINELGISKTPWQIGDGTHQDTDNEIRCPSTRGAGIFKVLAGLNVNFKEYHADAKLISAAPDLYSALLEMYTQMCGHCDLYQQCHECTEDGIWAPCNMMINAKEALHKACPDTAETEKDDSPF